MSMVIVSNMSRIDRRDRIELDMTKSALKGHAGNYFEVGEKELLFTSVIYGANAAFFHLLFERK